MRDIEILHDYFIDMAALDSSNVRAKVTGKLQADHIRVLLPLETACIAIATSKLSLLNFSQRYHASLVRVSSNRAHPITVAAARL
jgi:hypothetical protein